LQVSFGPLAFDDSDRLARRSCMDVDGGYMFDNELAFWTIKGG
jgi:hypothetical protein